MDSNRTCQPVYKTKKQNMSISMSDREAKYVNMYVRQRRYIRKRIKVCQPVCKTEKQNMSTNMLDNQKVIKMVTQKHDQLFRQSTVKTVIK